MPAGLLGKKLGMTRVFDEAGRALAVTVVQAGPCVVVQRRRTATDGYEAIQVGFGDLPLRKSNMPMTGHFKAHRSNPKRYLREFRLEADEAYEEGQELTVKLFEPGQSIEVTGWSKGRGFAGGMKRHGFRGGPATHGSKVHRTPQSAGATDAARVFPGKRSPGHMGNERVTIKGLRVIEVDPERHLILIRGAIPGPRGGLVIIRPAL